MGQRAPVTRGQKLWQWRLCHYKTHRWIRSSVSEVTDIRVSIKCTGGSGNRRREGSDPQYYFVFLIFYRSNKFLVDSAVLTRWVTSIYYKGMQLKGRWMIQACGNIDEVWTCWHDLLSLWPSLWFSLSSRWSEVNISGQHIQYNLTIFKPVSGNGNEAV